MKSITLSILGIYASGKSTLVHSFIQKKKFPETKIPEATIGAAYFKYIYDNHTLIEIWDTAGQERYASLLPMYTRKTDILLFVIDPTNIHSISYLEKIISPILGSRPHTPPYAIHIIITKYDTQRDSILSNILIERATKCIQDKLKMFAMPNVLIRSFITSTRTNKNIDTPFITGLDETTQNTTSEPLLELPIKLDTDTTQNISSRCCSI